MHRPPHFGGLSLVLDFMQIEGENQKMSEKNRNNDFHQLQHSSVVKTSVLGNWTNFEVDRTKIGMYMAIQIENLVLVPLTLVLSTIPKSKI